jgi:hypothetical protein
MNATVNDILREWRHLWPGGLTERGYSTLNLMAHCRHGELGFNRAECGSCHHSEWYASSCGDRHCPACLGPRQAKWSERACERLPDCPHFHVVFTVPEGFHEFFALNYRVAGDLLFSAADETLKTFQRNNWKMDGAFFGVLHTWGSSLNWHPHLHMLVSAGGRRLEDGRWAETRPDYLFPVKAMSRVFRGIMLRKIEGLEAAPGILWPETLRSLEERRGWRLSLATKGWNIFSRKTLGNTRAVVRYLARYTSRIAMSNRRITNVDEGNETVSFEWKDYGKGGAMRPTTLPGATFIRRFARHLVPQGFRRIRYYGLLCGKRDRIARLPEAPPESVAENHAQPDPKACKRCGGDHWQFHVLHLTRRACAEGFEYARSLIEKGAGSFSLVTAPGTG